jgi:tetratricopeptide (TPR) repeat protein
MGRSDVAIELAQEGIDLAQKIGHRGGELLGHRGMYLATVMREPSLDVAEALGRGDLERCEAIGSPWVAQSYAWLSMTDTFRGKLEGGLRHAEEAIRLEPPSAWTGIGWAFKALNRAFADRGECRAMLAEPLPELPGADRRTGIGPLSQVMGALQAAAMIEDADVCATLYSVVAPYADRWPSNLFDPAITHRVVGMAASRVGMWDEAEHHFAEAQRIATDLPNRWDEPQVWLWHGKMLLARGRTGDAETGRDLIGRAGAEFEKRGMPLHAKLAAV